MYTWDELQAAADRLAAKENCQFDMVLCEGEGKKLVVLHGFHGNLEMGLAYMVQEADANLRPDEINRFGASLCYLDNLETGECTELEECIQEFKRDLEAEQKHRERKEREDQAARAEAERQRFHGFTDGMSPMGKGKVVKILSKRYRFDEGVMTRAERVETMVKMGGHLSTWTNPRGNTEYRIHARNGWFYTVTKTEYEYFQYLKSR